MIARVFPSRVAPGGATQGGVASRLWIMIVPTVIAFAKLRPLAVWQLSPYLAWVTFASVLNASFRWLNR